MKKWMWCFFLLLLAVLAGRVALRSGKAEGSPGRTAGAPAAPVPVVLANVAVLTMPVEIHTFGSVEPATTVAVKSQITGILSKVLFTEGHEVKEGESLFEIDSRGPEAALKQAEAVLAKDRARLANALKEAGRQETLFAKGISAQDVRDEAVTSADTLKAVVQSDEAAVETARLQLSYCSIRSPVTGRAGSLNLHQGNLVKADDAPLVTINRIQPILARFALPQQELARVRQGVEEGRLTVVATPYGNGAFSETGTVIFVDNAIDEKTGTLQLKARFENTGLSLWPGQFVKIRLQLALQENARVVPETAVLQGQQGAYVYVVDQNRGVAPRRVVVDRAVDGQSVITDGLAPGEVVVTDGQFRLKPGSVVTPRTLAVPESTPAGRP